MKAFVIADPRKCIGCGACEIACASANSELSIPEAARLRAAFNPRLNLISNPEITMPIQCRQCEDAPCAKACPAGGIVYLNGVVHIRKENCIGCKMCILACPVGAVNILPLDKSLPRSNDNSELPEFYAQKCELCSDRKEGPACVQICPAGAFTLIDVETLKETVKSRREKVLRNLQ
ncbi:4Fe-4S dicluster domain-containing protein [Maridesulfovibrio ferrireducens]|uniref:4Fe-4S dicluster domain-containing protein n=1 Tax=Maridesulfovibrio ferrireducens TaxID=246191 RepID=UPI001A358F46|nr:4Fe-4S dicluster domain-containing protein [Maridesulfovibrio ferrireducens]MBI9113123.1 4Fe-4S dicluster domain-containing protein [Maridesulfovibrio ferrireducens]